MDRNEQVIAEVFALYERLSEASRRTLEYQGGVMSAEEAEAFEQDPLCEVSLRMRQWDEQAKEM
jgi:predicted HD phosphohydrolase